MKKAIWIASVVSLAMILFCVTFSLAAAPISAHNVTSEMNAKYADTYGKLPLSFIKNDGQLNKAVRYVINGPTASAFFTDTGVTFDLADPSALKSKSDVTLASYRPDKPVKHTALKMEFVDASSKCKLMGVGRLPGKVNVLKGRDSSEWMTGISTYKGIMYKNAWKGIDVAYAGNRKQVKYDIIVNPGAKVSDIKLRYTGADKISLDAKGDLNIKTAVSSFTETVPGIFQTKSGKQVALKGGYVLLDDHTIGFKVQGADPTLPIVIDPASELVYSTFIGGSDWDSVTSITADDNGCAYICGWTFSPSFPSTVGAYDATFDDTLIDSGGYADAFIVKLNPSGSALEYATFLGGSIDDLAKGIAVNDEGYVYICGVTQSYAFDSSFPVTTSLFNTVAGYEDAFIAKLNPSGSVLEYSFVYGSNEMDCALDIAVDSAGAAYVTGYTDSWGLPTFSGFPTTPGAFDTTKNGADELFVSKLNTSGTGLEYSTYLGRAYTQKASIAIDDQGCAYIAGSTDNATFPTTSGAYDESSGGSRNAFVTKFNATGSALVYSTFIGGTSEEITYDVAVDQDYCAYIAGLTLSSDYPVTPDAFDTSSNGNEDGFVTKLNSSGTSLVYSTYLGSSGNDAVFGVTVDNEGYAYITGTPGGNEFPVTPDALYPDYDRYWGSFVAKLDTSGSSLEYSTFFGGYFTGFGRHIALDSQKNVYIAGDAPSDNMMITTSGAYDTSFNEGAYDVFVAKLNLNVIYSPDLLMKAGNTAYGFNNIYSADGSSQTLALNAGMNQTVYYSFRAQNDGNVDDTYIITGPAGGDGWTVKYCDLNTNADVTAQVTGSGWSTGTLAPGATNGVYAFVTPTKTVASGSVNTLTITATSQGDATKTDVGKAVTTAAATYKTDLLVKAGYTSYDFNNIYSANGVSQTKTQNASINKTVFYAFRVQNDGNAIDTFKITGPASAGGWTYLYRDLTTNDDVTAQVTGSGWTSGALAPGETNGVYVYVTPGNTISPGATNTLTLTAVSIGDATKNDVGRGITTAVFSYIPDIHVKAADENYEYNNVYSADGNNQSKSQYTFTNQMVSYGFRVENDSFLNDNFKITGTAGGNGWTVRYYATATSADITAQVTGSGWSTGTLMSGSTSGIYVQITPDATVPAGSENILTITATSQGDTSRKDVCKVITSSGPVYKTDLLIKSGIEASYFGNNIYSEDGSNQAKSQNVLTDQTIFYAFRVQNDGNMDDTFTLTGPGSGDGWTIKYIDLITYNDVTDQVTGDGWSSGVLALGATSGVYVLVTPDNTVATGSENVLTITAESQGNLSKIDACKAVTTKQ
ncbi:MAG: DUF7948 domain-containing protein [Armatimonadota bacterium]